MKQALFIAACFLFCTNNLLAYLIGALVFFAVTLLPDTKNQQYEDHPL